jgi:hypothetical protein
MTMKEATTVRSRIPMDVMSRLPNQIWVDELKNLVKGHGPMSNPTVMTALTDLFTPFLPVFLRCGTCSAAAESLKADEDGNYDFCAARA